MSILAFYQKPFIILLQTPYLATGSNLYRETLVSVASDSCFKPNVNKCSSMWVHRMECDVNENVSICRVKRDREIVEEYVIQKMLDKKRNMHVEVSVRRYVICWKMVSEWNVCRCWRVWRWPVSNFCVTLDGIMFDCVIYLPFTVMVGCVRSKVYVHPRILDDVVMHVVVK